MGKLIGNKQVLFLDIKSYMNLVLLPLDAFLDLYICFYIVLYIVPGKNVIQNSAFPVLYIVQGKNVIQNFAGVVHEGRQFRVLVLIYICIVYKCIYIFSIYLYCAVDLIVDFFAVLLFDCLCTLFRLILNVKLGILFQNQSNYSKSALNSVD